MESFSELLLLAPAVALGAEATEQEQVYCPLVGIVYTNGKELENK